MHTNNVGQGFNLASCRRVSVGILVSAKAKRTLAINNKQFTLNESNNHE